MIRIALQVSHELTRRGVTAQAGPSQTSAVYASALRRREIPGLASALTSKTRTKDLGSLPRLSSYVG